MKMFSRFKEVFDWKQKPVNVFFVAIPLALLGFGIVLLNGLLKYKQDEDVGVLIIWAVGMIVLGVALVPAWRIHKATRKIHYKPE